jgi:hypothetical protein
MTWFTHLLTRRHRYDDLSDSIRESLDEKIADLTNLFTRSVAYQPSKSAFRSGRRPSFNNRTVKYRSAVTREACRPVNHRLRHELDWFHFAKLLR